MLDFVILFFLKYLQSTKLHSNSLHILCFSSIGELKEFQHLSSDSEISNHENLILRVVTCSKKYRRSLSDFLEYFSRIEKPKTLSKIAVLASEGMKSKFMIVGI